MEKPKFEKQLNDFFEWKLTEVTTRYAKWQISVVREAYEFTKGDFSLESIRKWQLFIKDKVSPKTYREKLLALRCFLKFLEFSYAKELRLPRVPKKLVKRITLEQVRELYSKMPSLELKTIVLLLATSGMRVGELSQLKTTDIDFEDRIICLQIDKERKLKDKEERYVIFNEEAKSHLERLIEESGGKLSFPSRDTIIHKFKKFGNGLTCHDLRRFFAQEMRRRKMPTEAIKLLLGHRLSGDITFEFYTGNSIEDLKQLYDSTNLKILTDLVK